MAYRNTSAKVLEKRLTKSALLWRLGGWLTKITRKIWSHCTRINSGGHHALRTYRFSTVNYSRTMTRSVAVTGYYLEWRWRVVHVNRMGKRNVLQSLQPCCKDRTVLVGTGMSQKRISGNVINRYQVFDVFKVFVEDNNGNSG
ncbi:Uncharacterized protein FWK35_00004579 [Aphis craccivora]|uniref:Uncharacterized protein n=1 Tax=Aphis craccivora TaxID=307492 RepID=A0A6G0ZME4_APHCR|nr:Uncharacterized protein FWK35_00004579 [Aphis craccivora]